MCAPWDARRGCHHANTSPECCLLSCIQCCHALHCIARTAWLALQPLKRRPHRCPPAAGAAGPAAALLRHEGGDCGAGAG